MVESYNQNNRRKSTSNRSDSSKRRKNIAPQNSRSNRSYPSNRNSIRSKETDLASYNRSSSRYRARKKTSGRKKALIIIACIIGIAIIGCAIAVVVYLNNISASLKMDKETLAAVEEELVAPNAPDDPYYVLLLGSDTRVSGAAARSDTIILCRVDPKELKATLISIPRDTKVEIEGHGTCKINAAYAYGGAPLAIKTVSEFAGVDIAHCAEIEFWGVSYIVDELGGVEVDVPQYTELDGVVIQPGLQTLNGEEAIAFARCRKAYAEGDFQRTENQRLLVQAIVKEVLASPVTNMPALISDLASCITTDYGVTELVDLALKFKDMDMNNMYLAAVPSYTQTIDGASYMITIEDEWKAMMQDVDAGERPVSD